MLLGLISDTHGYFDPAVPELFAGVEHILHGGDIGPASIIHELEKIAPVTAVLGNNDCDPTFKETELLALAGRKILIHHIVDLTHAFAPIHARIAKLRPDVVVFGHTHKPFNETRNGRLYVNPGYAGKPRFGMKRTVALLRVTETEVKVEFMELKSTA
ncbi:MAG: metallophosphoesterase family protein [Verrucomicrobia bacterium]|nr:metallophosphoesterase family protein [Verrucomicrobiota bacterium]